MTLGGPPSFKQWEILPWNRALKPTCAKAFGWDSDLVKEARAKFFLKHSYNFITEGTHNLSEVFKQMAMSTELLGTLIYKIQASWMGPNEPKQVNYALKSLPKGLKFLYVVPPSESLKVMGLVGIHDPDDLCCFSGITHYPWCGKEGRMRGPWSIIYRQCTTGWAWCVTDVMIAHPQWPTLSAAIASRTVANPGRKILMSQFHLSNHQKKQNCLSWVSKQGGQDRMVYTRLSYWEYPYPLLQTWRRTSG